MLNEIRKIHTTLTKEDLEVLKKMENSLKLLNEFLGVDVFIDVLTRDKDKALVIFQSSYRKESLYNRNIVGEFATRENEPAVLRSLETGLPSKNYKGITQEGVKVFQDVSPIKNEDNETIGVLIAERESKEGGIDKRGIFDDEILKLFYSSTENYPNERVVDFFQEGVIIFDENGKAVHRNLAIKKIYKTLSHDNEIIGEDFNNIVIDSLPFESIVESLKKNNELKREISISNKSFEVEYYSNYTDGKLSLYNIIRDVTRDKEREKELILKSVALKEIHHRVKNNLQTIASLLKMQKRRIENEECKKILEDSINRLVSMAITHEIMSQNGFDDLEIGDIIRLIYKNSFRSGIDKNKKILFTLFKEQLYIDSDKASSIALVVNEILQNISDHAFKGTDNCEVKIDLKEGPVFSSLIISDNGVGMDVEKVEKGLGMTIIKAIVEEKLKGKLKIVSIPQIGTTIEFDFKKTN